MHTYIYHSIYANIQNTLFHSLNKSVFHNLSGLVLQWTGWRWRGNYEFLCDVPAQHHEHNFQGKDRAMSRLSVGSVLFFRPMYWNFPNIAVSFCFCLVLFFLEPLVTFLPSSYIPSHPRVPPFLICLHYRNSYLIELINILGVHLERIKKYCKDLESNLVLSCQGSWY